MIVLRFATVLQIFSAAPGTGTEGTVQILRRMPLSAPRCLSGKWEPTDVIRNLYHNFSYIIVFPRQMSMVFRKFVNFHGISREMPGFFRYINWKCFPYL